MYLDLRCSLSDRLGLGALIFDISRHILPRAALAVTKYISLSPCVTSYFIFHLHKYNKYVCSVCILLRMLIPVHTFLPYVCCYLYT